MVEILLYYVLFDLLYDSLGNSPAMRRDFNGILPNCIRSAPGR